MVILRRKMSIVQAATETALLPLLPLRKVSYLQLQRVTNGFADSNLLGIGSFGSLYKGTLSDRIDVAIKVYL
ncbi:putative non-specific serine/threonine protein kinase [Rosa chinensis]|uniref:Putative non-specific serine/threonine protein kinase n=1 Tax=Rosa chinensis TaxID=74649 RepID=A0A2P6Q4T2_ROSCH|nr:putative non-specific serine/threonine protein kinase [Rosa chinensis]